MSTALLEEEADASDVVLNTCTDTVALDWHHICCTVYKVDLQLLLSIKPPHATRWSVYKLEVTFWSAEPLLQGL